jgi:hypothetical protein
MKLIGHNPSLFSHPRTGEIYTRQARNTEAERQACEIRLRAERKAGFLNDEREKAKGNRNTGEFGGRNIRPPNDNQTLAGPLRLRSSHTRHGPGRPCRAVER